MIEALLWQMAARALALGINNILDFGFWAKEERAAYRARATALGAHSEIIFMDVREEVLLERVRMRNAQLTDATAYIPEERMWLWIQCFQPPDADELEPQSWS